VDASCTHALGSQNIMFFHRGRIDGVPCSNCCREVFTAPLPSSTRLLYLQYSGFQASCHIAPLLQTALPEQATGVPPVLRGGVFVTSVIVFACGTATCCFQLFFIQFRRRPVFSLRRLGLALLVSNCSLLKPARLERFLVRCKSVQVYHRHLFRVSTNGLHTSLIRETTPV
jgi:hypothetical protein